MIGDIDLYRRFLAEWKSRDRVDLDRAFSILESLLDEAVELGVWPPADPMEGIEVDIRMAAVINSCTGNSSPP
jgi:hypothetical protein